MAMFRAGVIGCGGRGRAHARGYRATVDVKVVACADPDEAGRTEFSKQFDVKKTYSDYRKMLDEEDLDLVSVCTWTGMHRDMVMAAAGSGIRAIHSEKPMAPTWGASKELYRACVDNEVVITFCHQRRFEAPFVKAKALVDEGAIGKLIRVEGACPNLFDWGTHWFDMFFFYNNDQPAAWVMGQIDARKELGVFGVPLETSGLSWIRWQNGLEGLLATGDTELQGPRNRLIGTDGIIELGERDQPAVRVLRPGEKWEVPDLTDLKSPHDATVLSILDLVDCLKTGCEPVLSGRKALQATELIFATYESSRRRARVDLPLDVEDSALLTMLEEGMIGPERR
ncbi:MAG: Gfo/Idh/MocA family oxidoreductase [bacterium]|nr:Gfo/Idh/MocA family oxidoreductase [bacterium]